MEYVGLKFNYLEVFLLSSRISTPMSTGRSWKSTRAMCKPIAREPEKMRAYLGKG